MGLARFVLTTHADAVGRQHVRWRGRVDGERRALAAHLYRLIDAFLDETRRGLADATGALFEREDVVADTNLPGKHSFPAEAVDEK